MMFIPMVQLFQCSNSMRGNFTRNYKAPVAVDLL